MNILGITGFFHDTSAALLIDGELVAFVEEERLIRIKHAHTIFPEKSIEFCMKKAGLKFSDIDAIVCEHDMDVIINNDQLIEPYKSLMDKNIELKAKHNSIFFNAKNNFLRFAKEKGIKEAIFAPHHEAHLASTFFGSGFSEALILSIDGRGDTNSMVIAKGIGTQIEILDEILLPTSLGLLYASVTKYLGYTPFDGEGTVMGLAAYGKDVYSDFFNSLIKQEDFKFSLMPEISFNSLIDPLCDDIKSPLIKAFGPPRDFNPDPRNGIDENIAASLQAFLERIVIKYISHFINETGIKKLCLAGGVAQNSKMNGKIYKALNLEDIYAFPVSNDAGCAIGAAMWYENLYGYNKIKPITTIYTGPEFSPFEIFAALKDSPYVIEEPDDLAQEVAKLLHEHKIVAWFQGKMEGGARALGARSILSNPTSLEDKNNVNIKVKFREPWRPFAPSILYEERLKYIGCDIHSPFMTITFDVPKKAQQNIVGSMHIDNTIRVQTVKKEDNELYYDMISKFGQLSGISVVNNTSMNRKGEPIINTPKEALDMFANTELDALAIGPYLLRKPTNAI
ncbi:carbamoyltransferase family protein [Sulfurospirillum sp.]|uniref:carbamoyltransferase family protein n=1 Tax=Sulfurospirillum sp. TaxID=2053622 RepID=UPI002FDC7FD3